MYTHVYNYMTCMLAIAHNIVTNKQYYKHTLCMYIYTYYYMYMYIYIYIYV